MTALLERISIIDSQIAELKKEREKLIPLLEQHVKETGTSMGYGYVAKFKYTFGGEPVFSLEVVK